MKNGFTLELMKKLKQRMRKVKTPSGVELVAPSATPKEVVRGLIAKIERRQRLERGYAPVTTA